MSKPIEMVGGFRKRAIRRLFEQKFMAPVRITVGSATCENAAGADAVLTDFPLECRAGWRAAPPGK